MKRKEQNKEYYDKKRNTKESDIAEGDTVICTQRKLDKLTPKFNPERYVVIKRTGTKVVAKNERKIITRNVSHFKKVKAELSEDKISDDEDTTNPNEIRESVEQQRNIIPRKSQRSRIPVFRYGNPVPSNLK